MLSKNKSIDLKFATAVVIASMVGIGVYTSLGFQVADIKSVSAILLLWLIGGVASFCGALVYAEIALRYPGSGGEYNYLSKIYHPSIGFLGGWVSATVGFPGPLAAISIAFAYYLATFVPGVNKTLVACGLVTVICIINLMGLKMAGRIQKSLLYLNLLLIISFIIGGLAMADCSHFHITFTMTDAKFILTPAFAVCLVYVAYSYVGWNAVTYVAGEVENPKRNIPASLIIAISIVTVLYLLLNFVFLYSTPMEALAGKIEVAQIAALSIFGPIGLQLISVLLIFGLLASTNSFMVQGSYMTNQVFDDYNLFKNLRQKIEKRSPVISILLQAVIALIFILSYTFEQVVVYMGFTLTIFSTLTVIGVFFARKKQKDYDEGTNYKIPWYPLPIIVVTVLQLWMLIIVFLDKQFESMCGIGTTLLGLVIYFVIRKRYLSS